MANKQPQKRTEPIVQPNKEITISPTDELTITVNGNELGLILNAIQRTLTMEAGVPLTKKIEAQIIAQKA